MNKLDQQASEMVTYIVSEIRKIQKAHYDSTTPMDSYFTGMWNGMELVVSTISGQEPCFKDVEVVK